MAQFFLCINQILFIIKRGIKVIILECVWNLMDQDNFVKLVLSICTEAYFSSDKSREKMKIGFDISVLYDTLI